MADPGIRFTIIVGLAGIGKTSLAGEFAQRFRRDDVFWHTCSPFDSARHLLELAACWLDGADSPLVRGLELPGMDVANAIQRVTALLSRRKGLLVLDDFDKTRDEGVIEVARRWQRDLGRAKVLVLSRTRPRLDLQEGTQLITLSGLAPEASRSLLRNRLPNASDEEVDRLVRASGGHPLALVLYGMASSGEADLAKMVVMDLGRRAIESLDPRARDVLLSLAAVRRHLKSDDVAFLSGIEDAGLHLAMLERRGLVRSAGRSFEVHDVLRESLAQVVDQRSEFHRRAVALYLSTGRPLDRFEACRHALHALDFAQIGDLLEGYLLRKDQPFFDETISGTLELLNEIPEEPLTPRHRALLHAMRGGFHSHVSAPRVVEREYRAAIRLAESIGDQQILATTCADFGDAQRYTDRRQKVEKWFQRYLELVEAIGWTERRGDAYLRLHSYYDDQADIERAKRYLDLALGEAHRTRNTELEVEITTFWPMSWPADWRKVVPTLQRRIGRYKAKGSPMDVALLHRLIGEVWCRSSRLYRDSRRQSAEEALRHFERSITASEAMGDRWVRNYAQSWRALALLQVGRIDEAEDDARRVIGMQRSIGRNTWAIISYQVLAQIHQIRGDWLEARNTGDEAVRNARLLYPRTLGIAMLERAFIEEAAAPSPQSREMLREAIAETVTTGYPDEVRLARRAARQRGLRKI